jgi:Na+/glutamate symporter
MEQRRSRLRDFLERLDATLDASLAATLAGLALAAGAFASEGLASFRASDAYRRALENSRDSRETSSDKEVLKAYDQQKSAVKNLMNAFLVFAACLAINVGVDPIQVLSTDWRSLGNMTDLAGTGVTTAVGVGFMVAGAIGIIKRARD